MDFLIFLLYVLGAIVAFIIGLGCAVAVLILSTPFYFFRACWIYYAAMLKHMYDDSSTPGRGRNFAGPLLSRRAHVDQRIAYPSYFFGPVSADMEKIFSLAAANYIDFFGVRWEWVSRRYRFDSVTAYILNIGLKGGLILGSTAGAGMTALAATAQLVLTAAAITVATCAFILLRGLDTSKRLARHVIMSCPTCQQKVQPYPAYRCQKCDSVHRDIRPGSHGVLTRICRCGQRMPTSLLTGASKLVAACPNCSTPLPSRFGAAGEAIIPIFGSNNVGKTQLLYNVITAIVQLVSRQGGSVNIDDGTRNRLQPIADDLLIAGRPSRTLPQIPEAYVLHVTLGSNERLIYLFDAAGEIYSKESSLLEVRYLNLAHTLVFVTDPLAADAIWDKLSPEQQGDLAGRRSRALEIQKAYEATSEYMKKMTRRRRIMPMWRSSALAFVLSKADILDGISAAPVDRKEVRQLIKGSHGLNLGNLVREAEHSFNNVEFFQTAAVRDAVGKLDTSVITFTQWLMAREGLQFDSTRDT